MIWSKERLSFLSVCCLTMLLVVKICSVGGRWMCNTGRVIMSIWGEPLPSLSIPNHTWTGLGLNKGLGAW